MITIIDLYCLGLVCLFFGVPYWVVNSGGRS